MIEFLRLLSAITIVPTIISFCSFFIISILLKFDFLNNKKDFLEGVADVKIYFFPIGKVSIIGTFFGFLLIFSSMTFSNKLIRDEIKEVTNPDKKNTVVLVDRKKYLNINFKNDLFNLKSNENSRHYGKKLKLELITNEKHLKYYLIRTSDTTQLYHFCEINSDETIGTCFGEIKTHFLN